MNILFFEALLLNIEAHQPCQRTTKWLMDDLLSNGLHEVVIYTDAQSVKKISMAMIISQQMNEEGLNDTHLEELVLYWKNSLKYKVGCFWPFLCANTIN